ncbi:MAG: GntR family transcriptional regulator [Hyphomicrobiales bacterium]|nr:GntR family transcriptional regulator [Hyphomicrobiales bacterium]
MGKQNQLRRYSEPGATAMRTTLRARVHDDIRRALITGRIVPGRGITLRGLATELGVSPMPVREAVHQLAAERALSIGPTGRIQVPEMTPERFNDLIRVRILLEPEAARMALPNLDRSAVFELRSIDDGINQSLVDGDVEAYMRLNHDFHFRIYQAAGSEVFLGAIESVWLQFGPFMRTVYGRLGTANLVDQHDLAIAAIAAGDPAALSAAITRDITDGMDLIGPDVMQVPASA